MVALKFNPKLVAKAEIGWWKAHNDKDKRKMLKFLIQQYIELYSMTENEAKVTLKPLVVATKYHDSRNWKQAKETVTNHYNLVKRKTKQNFEPRELAELEVGWWKIHDELEDSFDKSSLAETFAKLYATQYGIDKEKMKKAGKLKAQATYEHDLAEDPNTPAKQTEAHWRKAEKLLVDFYNELGRVSNSE
ncbi:MAG: Isoprenyl transferase [Parcubacteria group bacterium Gr01-1014_107]|nr:MAG: Isoprenyl transferase [Parcubacteria group bacterium Gr01-1014_107]